MASSLPDFHDGWFDGLVVDEDNATIFLRTYNKQRFVVSAVGVVALSASGVKKGNIILDAELFQSEQITVDLIDELYDLAFADPLFKREKLQQAARDRKLILFVIRPSYGATCLILAESVSVKTA